MPVHHGYNFGCMVPQPGSSYLPCSPLARLGQPLRQLPVYHSDLLVVGSGVAGLSCALAAAEEGCHVMVLSKGALSNTNTAFAQGGIAAAMGQDDRPELHAADTLDVGYGLSDPEPVHCFTQAARNAIQWLIDAGMQFDRDPGRGLSLAREGGHRVARVLHSGGAATGRELQRVLSARARNNRQIDLFEHFSAVELLKDAEGQVRGLVALRRGRGTPPQAVVFESRAVVLATGGGGQIFRETTNPQLATGDGLAMALRAGVELQDLEFVQFHPTILYLAGAARFLISEVTRGAGAVLRDRHGAAFMQDVHPLRDLAPRDVVSRAIFETMVRSGDTHVSLDLTAVEDPASRFPELSRIAGLFGMDLARDPIPVRPAVHYMVGGVRADLDGRTNTEGLWAVGECASTGFHGANRMGSNSLLEGLVHGRRAGRALAGDLPRQERRFLLPGRGRPPRSGEAELNLLDMTYSLKSMMWRQVGIERDAAGLKDALTNLHTWEGYLARLGPFTPEAVEVVNMVQVGAAIAQSALFRCESRGTHYRTDHPRTEEDWNCHSLMWKENSGLRWATRPVPGSGQASPDLPASDLTS